MHAESLDTEVSLSLSQLRHRRTCRVRGPRPFSWTSSTSDSSPNEYRDVWPWSNLSLSTRRSSSPDSTLSSSSSHPVHSDSPDEARHYRRRKPAGPRAHRDSACFDVQRMGLVINTSPSMIPRFQREDSPILWGPTPFDSTDMRRSSQTPTFVHAPSSLPLDWDAIFELLGCSEEI